MDIYADKGSLLRARFGDSLPDLIKQAAFLDEATRTNLPDSAFAYVNGKTRELPVVDSGNVAISAIYFLDGKDAFPKESLRKVASALVDACNKFEMVVPAPLKKLASLVEWMPPPTKKVEPTSDNLERSIAFFLEKGADYAPPRRREIAQDFVKTAAELNVSGLPEVVVRYASNAWNPELSQELELRAAMLKQANDEANLELLAELSEQAFQCDIEKFAEALMEIDRRSGLIERYDTRLTDAYLSTFGAPEEDMSATIQDLQKFASSDMAKASFANEVLVKLAADPEEALDTVDPALRDMLLAAFDAYLGNA